MPSDSVHSNVSSQHSKFDRFIHSDKPTFKSQYTTSNNADTNSLHSATSVKNSSAGNATRARQNSINSMFIPQSNINTPTSRDNYTTSKDAIAPSIKPSNNKNKKKSSQNLLKKTFSSLSINTSSNNNTDNNPSLMDTDFINNNTTSNPRLPSNILSSSLSSSSDSHNPHSHNIPHPHPTSISQHIPPRKTSFAGSILKRLSGSTSSSTKNPTKDTNILPTSSNRNSVLIKNTHIPSQQQQRQSNDHNNSTEVSSSISNRRPSMASTTTPSTTAASSLRKQSKIPSDKTTITGHQTVIPSNRPGLFPLDTNLDDLTDITKTVLPTTQPQPQPQGKDQEIEIQTPSSHKNKPIESIIQPPQTGTSVSPMTVTNNNEQSDNIIPLTQPNVAKTMLKRASVGNDSPSQKIKNKKIDNGNITPSPSNSLTNMKNALGPKKSHSVGDFTTWSMTKNNNINNPMSTPFTRTINESSSNNNDNNNNNNNNNNNPSTATSKENKWVAPESWDVDPAIDREKQKNKKRMKRKLRKQREKLLMLKKRQNGKSNLSMTIQPPSSRKSSISGISSILTPSLSDTDSDYLSDSDSLSSSTSSSESLSSSEEYYGITDNSQFLNDNNTDTMHPRDQLKNLRETWDSSRDDLTSKTFSSINLSTSNKNANNDSTFNPSTAVSSQLNIGDGGTVNLSTLTAVEDDRIDRVERQLEHYYKDTSDLDSKKHYAIRIFNVDDTFTTLSCTPGTTVEDMIPMLKKKFNITLKSNYQISLKVGKLSKILRPTAKPIVIERKLLLLNGYKKSDPLHIIGIEDLSFVFKFLFHPVIPSHFTPEQEQRLLRSDFVHVDLRNMDLTTPPIIFYQHTSEIESLDVSNNANIFLPLEFIESSIKLMSLRMVNVRASRFPVNLTEAYKLVSLELQRNFIKKVPKTISKLGNLTILNLQCNELDKLPSSFGSLKNLQLLDLSSNKFVSYPEVINNCTNLLQIDLSYNKIHNIPNSINQLNKLAKINISHNKLVEIESLSDMKNLRTLNLRYNRITTVHTLAPNLQNLFLTDNRISNFEDTLPKLRTLELQENPITSISFKDFYPLNMTSLSLNKAQLSSIPGELFTELSRLEKLELSENNLSSLPKQIGLLNKLIYLSVARNKLESLPAEFANLKSLRSLDLHYNNIREFFSGIEDIELTYLNISSNAFGNISSMDNVILPNFTQSNKLVNSLLFLVAADNQFTDEMWPFFNKFVNLKLLNLSYNNFTDISTLQLNNLTELYMSGNKLSTIPSEIVLKWKELKVLMLNGNQLLTLPAELSHLSQLTTFDLGSNQLKYNISNYHYDWNWRTNKELKYLNFSANRKFEIRSCIDHETGSDFSDLTVLRQLKVLGLMDVTLNTSKVPDENSNFRLRTTASIINGMRYGVADSLGQRDHVSTRDVTFERFRGNDDECLICLHDSKNQNSDYGHNVSRIVRDIYDKILIRQLEKYGDDTDDNIKKSLRFSFLQLNKEINGMLNSVDNGASIENLTSADLLSGACSTVVYIKKDKIFTANLGDCMAILCKNNGDFQTLTKQHLPTKREEYERIRISGGYVNNGKLDGVADVSRAVGFFDLLPHIHASPDISLTALSATDDMLIIATHKLWEYLDIQMACDIAREHSTQPMIAAEAMKDHAIAYGCSENLTIICLSLHTTTEQENQFALNKNALLTRRSTFEDTALRRLQPEIAPPTGNLAVVFTDIKNSTFLWELFPNAMRTAIKTHNDLMRRQLRIFGGYEVKTEGDAFMVTFPTPTSALAWCLNVQLKLLDVQWPEEITSIQDGGLVTDSNGVKIYQGLSVRMGMHWGHPVTELDLVTQRMDYLGPVVNKASRVSSVADGGQITLSNDFISEFNKIMKYHRMVIQEKKTLQEVYGEEIVGEVLEREIAMLESIGWVFFDYGEQKLKGLETKEFITLVYPKVLASRHEFIEKDTEAKAIDEDLLFNLRTTSNRLESILSTISGGSLELESPKAMLGTLDGAARSSIMNSMTEKELLAFLDHLVTRIESTVVLLQLRQRTQDGLTIYNKNDRNGANQSVFDILDEVLASYEPKK